MDLTKEIENFSKSSLRQTATTVTRTDGSKWIEKGGDTSRITDEASAGFVVDSAPDLQIGHILPDLFLSSVDVAYDESLLSQHKITHILNVAASEDGVDHSNTCRDCLSDNYVRKHVGILDLPEINITQYFDECFGFIDSGLQAGGRVLVHCIVGVSRSASIVIGYLMSKQCMDFETAYHLVKQKRPSTQPNHGFMKQLMNYERQLNAAR